MNNPQQPGQQGQRNQPDVRAAGQGQQGQQGTGTGQQGFEAGQGNVSLVCSQTQVVQDGTSVSDIASRFFNNAQGLNTVILCVPAQTDTANAGAAGTGTGQQGQFQQGQQGTGGTTGQGFNLTPGQGMLIVENLADSDIIFDVTQPNPTSAWVGPGQQQQFALPAGTYSFMGHHPLGDFGITPGQVQVSAGQVTRLSCSANLCQPVLSQQGQQQQGQQGQFQQGQQQGQSQQGQQDQFQQGQQQQSDQPSDDNNGGDGS
jgi:hypothetical protein